jgi:signal transduction histidine kinase
MRLGLGWQVAVVGLLMLGSLGVLLSSNLATIGLSQHEVELHEMLSAASLSMAKAAEPLLDELTPPDKKPKKDWHRRLARVTQETLFSHAGAEGGFFLAGERNEFAGYAFPNDPHALREPLSEEPLKKEKKEKKSKKGKKSGNEPPPLDQRIQELSRREPPPKERPFILAQCRASVNVDPDAPPIAQVLDVGPSRVMIVTHPVGSGRPAAMATWIMVRLTSPEQLAADLRRYQISTGLALAGVFLSLALTIRLARSLHLERCQRELLREELRRSEHLASLGKLLAGVAHEVRNPLAAIRSTVQLWQRLPEQASHPAAAEPILNAVDRLNALVGRLLFFVRTAYDDRRIVNVNAVVQEAVALHRAQAASQGVLLKIELAAELPRVVGSAQALQQVVLNLLTNALQAMPSGGTLLNRTSVVDEPSSVELTVADTGPGMPPAVAAHLFEPFYTTRPEGTGLGLALCREIVQQHGGQIVLVQQPGRGAIFRVTLPLKEQP